MPQLLFRGIRDKEVAILSKDLLDKLSEISNTPKDYFIFEHSENKTYYLGEEVGQYPLVEIKQFKRDDIVEKKMSEEISDMIKTFGYNECEVYFIHLDEEKYFCY